MWKNLTGCQELTRQKDEKERRKEKRKFKPFKDNWIDVRVTLKGTNTGQRTTRVGSTGSEGNVTKNENYKGKLRLSKVGRRICWVEKNLQQRVLTYCIISINKI